MTKKTTVILSLMFLFISPLLFAETIVLKSGKTVEGKILERTDKSIKVNIVGIPITYYFDEIASIDGATPSNKTEETRPPQTTAVDLSSSGIDTEHIHTLLKHLGYPENTWPAIEKELIAFLTKIDFPKLKQEAANVKSDPEQLKQFVSKLGRLIEQEGCLDIQPPHPLIRLLVTSLGTDDIFKVIDTSPISQQQKEESRKILVSCSAVSQLGSILLESLGMNVKTVFAPRHIFNCIPLDDQQILFVDFLNQVFEIVDLSQYYKLEGKYMVLKEEYRLSPGRVNEIFKQWQGGIRPDTLKELLNCPFWVYIYITDDYVATPAIYNNRGDAYNQQGNFAQAISDCTKAIEINPNLADAYVNCGLAYAKQGNFSQAFSDFTKAIEINPNLAEVYYNRGLAYFGQKDFTKAWEDVHKTENLGAKINPEFLEMLKKASGRES